MNPRKSTLEMSLDENIETDSDSDVSMTSDSDSDEDITDNSDNQEEAQDNPSKSNDSSEGEEEDELIKAIKRERDKQRDHPPNIVCEDHIVDLSFHPQENILAVATIVGDVLIYKYTNDKNELVDTHELHLKACRDIEFDEDGKILFSTAKDKVVMLTDVATGKLIRCYEDCHEVPVYCLSVIDENIFATGNVCLVFNV